MSWSIDFYSEGVRLAIEALPVGIRASHARAMGDGLFELRLRGAEGIARVFYCARIGRRIVVLHVFIKKTEETPKRELAIARRRQREISKS